MPKTPTIKENIPKIMSPHCPIVGMLSSEYIRLEIVQLDATESTISELPSLFPEKRPVVKGSIERSKISAQTNESPVPARQRLLSASQINACTSPDGYVRS